MPTPVKSRVKVRVWYLSLALYRKNEKQPFVLIELDIEAGSLVFGLKCGVKVKHTAFHAAIMK